jgi:hypothetical protein
MSTAREYPAGYCLMIYGGYGACLRTPGHEGKCQDADGYRFDGQPEIEQPSGEFITVATMQTKPGSRLEQRDSHRMAFMLYASNTSNDIVVRFDGFIYNTLVPADRFIVRPDEPFRP